MIEQNYSIEEILLEVDEIQTKKNDNKIKKSLIQSIETVSSGVPKHTLKLIEEAEETK
jgi:hypothetical protein